MYGIDHVVIFVADLDLAVEEFSDQKFTVTPGGIHAGGLTKNALVAFQDSTYLELLTFTPRHAFDRFASLDKGGELDGFLEGRSALDGRFVPRAVHGPGIRDFALRGRAHDAVTRGTGLQWAMQGPIPGERNNPDGTLLEWKLAIPAEPGMPFVIEDVTPLGRRIPHGNARIHENGVQGILEVTLAVPDVLKAAAGLTDVFGLEAQEDEDGNLVVATNPGCIRLEQREPPFGPVSFKLWDAEGWEWEPELNVSA